MPSVTRGVELNLPKAEPLADLYGVTDDLTTAIHLCDEAQRLEATERPDRLVVEALVAAALIRYFRCFSTSPRLGLRHVEIARLGKLVYQRHVYFRALRDKFVAHCINPFDETWVTAMAVVRDGVPQPVTALGHAGHRIMLSSAEAGGIKFVAKAVQRLVNHKIEREKKKVLRIVQKLPLDAIHASDLRSPRPFRLDDVSRSRKQTVAKV